MGAPRDAAFAAVPPFSSHDPLAELCERVTAEVADFIADRNIEGLAEVPKLQKSRELAKGDFVMLWAPYCSRNKIKPQEFTAELAKDLQVRRALGAPRSPTAGANPSGAAQRPVAAAAAASARSYGCAPSPAAWHTGKRA